MTIWVRADANNRIGTGHVMRCLTVAEALKKQGGRVVFLTCEETAKEMIEKRGFEAMLLYGKYDDLLQEMTQLKDLLAVKTPDFLLMDSYYASYEYLKALKAMVPVGLMDDTCRNDVAADVLINYNIFADKNDYAAIHPEPEFLLGASFAPVRPAFSEVEYTVREKAEKVLISTGGTDRPGIGPGLLKAISEEKALQELEFHVVSGPFNVSLPKLKELSAEHPNFVIHENVAEMWQLMQQCDIAVSAGGSTMYELGTVGLPVLCYSFVDNQEKLVQGFEERNLVYYRGDYIAEGASMYKTLAQKTAELAGDFAARRKLHLSVKELFDGRGAERLAKELLRYTAERQ